MAHPVRRRILDELRRQPGLRLHELGEMVGQASGSLKWHLQTLERAGLISSFLAGQARYFTLQGIAPEDLALAHAVAYLRSYRRSEVLLFLDGHPAATVSQAAEALGGGAGSARNALDALVQEGLAVRDRPGVAATYAATPLGRRAAVQLRRAKR